MKRDPRWHCDFFIGGRRYWGSTKQNSKSRARIIESAIMAEVRERVVTILFNFVPERYRRELPACHFIPMTDDGKAVDSMRREYSQAEVLDKLKTWLRDEIQHLEQLDMSEGEAA